MTRVCEQCSTSDDTVEPFSCEGGHAPDGLDLCDDCRPSHHGCPWCDPADPKDR